MHIYIVIQEYYSHNNSYYHISTIHSIIGVTIHSIIKVSSVGSSWQQSAAQLFVTYIVYYIILKVPRFLFFF